MEGGQQEDNFFSDAWESMNYASEALNDSHSLESTPFHTMRSTADGENESLSIHDGPIDPELVALEHERLRPSQETVAENEIVLPSEEEAAAFARPVHLARNNSGTAKPAELARESTPLEELRGAGENTAEANPEAGQTSVQEWLGSRARPYVVGTRTTLSPNKRSNDDDEENQDQNKKKRKQEAFIEQLLQLHWDENDNPTLEDILKTAEYLALSPGKVFNWYIDRRERSMEERQELIQQGIMAPPRILISNSKQLEDNEHPAIGNRGVVRTNENNLLQSTASRSLHPDSQFSTEKLPHQYITTDELLSQTTISENPDKPYICTVPDCNESFSKHSDWKRHEEKVHWLESKYLCVLCGVSPENDGAWSCVSCQQLFSETQMDVIAEHVLHGCPTSRKQTTNRPFKRDFDLKQHFNAKHRENVFFYPYNNRREKNRCLLCSSKEFFSEEEGMRHIAGCALKQVGEAAKWRKRFSLKQKLEFASCPLHENWRYQVDNDNWPRACKYCHVPVAFENLQQRKEHSFQHFPRPKRSRRISNFSGRRPGTDDDDKRAPDDDTQHDNSSQHGDTQPRSNNKDGDDSRGNRSSRGNGEGSSTGRQVPTAHPDQTPSSTWEPREEREPDLQCGAFENVGQGADAPTSVLSLRMLGTGATSAVDEVSDSKHPGQVLARKKIAHGRTSKRFTFAKVAREIMLLKKLRHPHIVKLVDSYTTPTSTELLMSPVADCDLATFMKSCAQDTGNDYVCDSSTINRMGSWIGCLSSALAYMHGEGVIHGDLKPQNVLVKGSRVWLADFGIAMAENSRDTSKDFSMTPMYCAREVWSRSCRGRPADIWSFGCVILEMCACMAGKSIQNLQESQTIGRSKPYHEDIQATLRWLELLRLFFEYFEHLRSVTYILGAVASMLLADPQARATADEVRGQLAPNNCCRQLLDHVSHTSDRKTPSGFLWENKFEEGFNGCVLDENYRSGYDVDGPQPSTHSGCHKIGAYPRELTLRLSGKSV